MLFHSTLVSILFYLNYFVKVLVKWFLLNTLGTEIIVASNIDWFYEVLSICIDYNLGSIILSVSWATSGRGINWFGNSSYVFSLCNFLNKIRDSILFCGKLVWFIAFSGSWLVNITKRGFRHNWDLGQIVYIFFGI